MITSRSTWPSISTSIILDQLRELNAHVDAPADLNPVDWLETHLATGWRHATIVELDAPYHEVAPWISRPMGVLEPLDDGARCVLRGTTSNTAMYAGEWLAAIPHPFRIVDSPELSTAVVELAHRLLRAIDVSENRPG